MTTDALPSLEGGPDAGPRHCTNCDATLVDVYCAACGERQPHAHDLTMKHFAHEVVHELAHVDSKLFHTLRDLVLRPGQLTVDYFGGRKNRAIPPLRLFLTLFAIQFIAFTFYKPAAMYSVATFRKFDTRGALGRLLDKKAAKHHMAPADYDEKIEERWRHNVSMLQLVNVAGIAIVLKVLYARRRRYFVEHLVFAAHYLAFSYLLSLAMWPVYAINGVRPGTQQIVLATTHIALNLVYLFLAQRTFYGMSKPKAAVKTALLWGGTYVVSVFILAGSLVAALLQYR